MSYIYSRALVVASLGDNFSDTEPSAPLNGNPTPRPCLWHDKTMEPSRLSRFGVMCKPLTESLGAELLTLFVAGFPARTSALPEKEQESQANEAECGATWRASLAKFDPDLRSWKTVQLSLLGDSALSSVIWPRWGMTQDGECWELPMLADNTNGTESGLLPTVTKELFSHWASAKQIIQNGGFRQSGARIGSIFWWKMTENHIRLGGIEDRELVPDPSCGESLMGWPIGQTELTPLVTDKYQEWLQQHGECLAAPDLFPLSPEFIAQLEMMP